MYAQTGPSPIRACHKIHFDVTTIRRSYIANNNDNQAGINYLLRYF